MQTTMWLITAGFGIAPTTATLADIERPGLVYRKLPGPVPPVQTVLAWRRSDRSPFVSAFRESFAELKAGGTTVPAGTTSASRRDPSN